MVRLQIYTGVALYELHLPLLQYGKRDWESGDMPTEEFRYTKNNPSRLFRAKNRVFCRKTLFEPRDLLIRAIEVLKDETNIKLPEGQLRLQVKDTLAQLEGFMKTVGCEF